MLRSERKRENIVTGLMLLCIGLIIWFGAKAMVASWGKQIAAKYYIDPVADRIRKVLDADKQQWRLIDVWPEAPEALAEIAKKYDIDPMILPCIDRAEGLSRVMCEARNAWGMEYRGKLIVYPDYYTAACSTASLLARNRWRYEVNGNIDVGKLAEWYCPVSKDTWAKNVGWIYQQSIK